EVEDYCQYSICCLDIVVRWVVVEPQVLHNYVVVWFCVCYSVKFWVCVAEKYGLWSIGTCCVLRCLVISLLHAQTCSPNYNLMRLIDIIVKKNIQKNKAMSESASSLSCTICILALCTTGDTGTLRDHRRFNAALHGHWNKELEEEYWTYYMGYYSQD